MKNSFFLSVIALTLLAYSFFVPVALTAQDLGENELSLGGGMEWNMNSREMFAGAFSFIAGFNLPVPSKNMSIGTTAVYSNNFFGFSVVEIAGIFRWYFVGQGYSGFFVQADLGAYLFMEEGNTTPLFAGGLRGGYRFLLGKFYLEPYGRLGYPFAFGVGMVGGVSLQLSKNKGNNAPIPEKYNDEGEL